MSLTTSPVRVNPEVGLTARAVALIARYDQLRAGAAEPSQRAAALAALQQEYFEFKPAEQSRVLGHLLASDPQTFETLAAYSAVAYVTLDLEEFQTGLLAARARGQLAEEDVAHLTNAFRRLPDSEKATALKLLATGEELDLYLSLKDQAPVARVVMGQKDARQVLASLAGPLGAKAQAVLTDLFLRMDPDGARCLLLGAFSPLGDGKLYLQLAALKAPHELGLGAEDFLFLATQAMDAHGFDGSQHLDLDEALVRPVLIDAYRRMTSRREQERVLEFAAQLPEPALHQALRGIRTAFS